MWCQHCGILVRNLPGMLTTHWAGVYLEAGAGGGGGRGGACLENFLNEK